MNFSAVISLLKGIASMLVAIAHFVYFILRFPGHYYREVYPEATRNGGFVARGLALLLCSLALASCSSSVAPSSGSVPGGSKGSAFPAYSGPVNRPVPTTGCGKASPIALGSSVNVTIPVNPAVSEGYRTRVYRVHVPLRYDRNSPRAVVLVFHGYTGSAAGMETSTGFSRLADQQNFFAVYPQGLANAATGKAFWASAGPIDFGVDDVLFVSNILDDLQSKFCIDSHRIFATGFSNGGGMSWLLSCRFAGRIAAFAPVSGNFYALPGGCRPGRPVAILDFHGTRDPLLPYNGIPISEEPAWPLPSIAQWLSDWASRNGCTRGPVIFLQESRVTGEQWSGCSRNASVVHYRVNGGGHAWPPTIDGRSGAEVIWNFFQDHPLPGT